MCVCVSCTHPTHRTAQHEEELPDKKDATFQAALLYTTKGGERRVRVFNAALPVTTQLPLVFRMADLDATLTLIARQVRGRPRTEVIMGACFT